MKKRILLITVVMLLLIFTAINGAAAQSSSGGGLSRGQFATMLCEVAGVSTDLAPAEFLLQKGVMKGYPGGELYLERGITRLEAAALVAKMLGMAEGIVPPRTAQLPVGEEHWGYTFYGWLHRFGLTGGSPGEMLTAAQGEDFLETVFSSDPAAVSILEEAQRSTKTVKTMRSTVNGSMNITPRAGVEGAEEIPSLDFKMKATQEMVFPGTIHQLTSTYIPLPDEGVQEFVTEMYLVDGKMYQRVPKNIENGEMQWMRFPEALLPNLEELMNAEEAVAVIPAGLEKYLHYRLLGKTVKNGAAVHELACYGTVDDFSDFIGAVSGQFGSGQQIQQLLSQATGMIDAMSFWIIQYVGLEDCLTRGAEMFYVITFKEEFLGAPNPLEALQVKMNVEAYTYNEDIVINLPAEALNAPMLELPAMPADLQQP